MKVQTIWKFPIETTDFQNLVMPKGAKVLCVQIQDDNPFIWAMVDPSAEKEERSFLVLGTGHPVQTEDLNLDYIGTYQLKNGLLVFHLFESTVYIPYQLRD